jgi:hypothetical protein
MNGLPDSLHLRRQAPLKIRLLVFLSIWLIPFTVVKAANTIYVDIAKSGTTKAVDTLFSGGSYDFRVWIENDARLSSFRITLRNWITLTASADADPNRGTYFTWENVGGYGPTGLNTGHACVTVQPGSRMDPPSYVWDYGAGFRVWEYNMNETSPDTLGFGGNAVSHGLQPGPLQHMVTIHFKATTLALNIIYLWMDSAYISPGGGIIFVDFGGNLIIPQFSTHAPWKLTAKCGDANGDGTVDVADVVFLVKYVFKSGPAPKPVAVGDVNNDLDTNVADIVYLINYVFKFGPPPDCP